MKNISSSILICFLVLSSLSCGPRTMGDNDVLRSATDVPDMFDTPVGMNWDGNNCINPIIDPVDGTELILIGSHNGLGDYRVSGRKYGVERGELLRINCSTGEVMGIVRE